MIFGGSVVSVVAWYGGKYCIRFVFIACERVIIVRVVFTVFAGFVLSGSVVTNVFEMLT